MASPAEKIEGAGPAVRVGPPQYRFPEFRPLAWMRGGHAQTIAGAYVPHQRIRYAAVAHEITMPDGDRTLLHDDRPEGWRTGDPCVLLLHGLGGCHGSPYMVRIAAKLNARRTRVFRLDLRGHGAAWKLAQHPGHAGRSEDARTALNAITQWCPHSPVVGVGFSMGGNILLKLLGELGDAAPTPLVGAMAIAPPTDLAFCSRHLREQASRIYTRTFLRALVRQVEQRRPHIPALARIDLPKRLESVWEFDDRVTAPLSGFADAADYYARSSSAPLLDRIRVPTVIVTAADDPLIPVAMFDTVRLSATTRLHVTAHGGHVGYLAAGGADPDRRWLDWRVVELAESLFAR